VLLKKTDRHDKVARVRSRLKSFNFRIIAHSVIGATAQHEILARTGAPRDREYSSAKLR